MVGDSAWLARLVLLVNGPNSSSFLLHLVFSNLGYVREAKFQSQLVIRCLRN